MQHRQTVLPPNAKLLVKFVPRLPPPTPTTPALAKVTDKATPPRGGAGEGRECGGGGARREGTVGWIRHFSPKEGGLLAHSFKIITFNE